MFLYAVRALYVLFATRELGLDAVQIGPGAGGWAGSRPSRAACWRPRGRRWSASAVDLGRLVLSGAALLLIPLATAQTAIPVLIAAQAIGGLAETIANVNQWSLRQVVTPDNLQARVTASHRFLVYGALPVGALLGGALATATDLRAALILCAAGAAFSPLLLLASPLKALREPPVGKDDAARRS